MSTHHYISLIKLRGRDNGLSLYFEEVMIDLRVIPYRTAEDMENPPRGMFLHGPQLGEWNGTLVVPNGAYLHKHLDRYFLETDLHYGDICLEKAEIEEVTTKLWFTGLGDLASVELEKGLKEALEPHGMW